MIVLDTNVLSEVMHPRGASAVADWLDRQPGSRVAVTAITVAEIGHGIQRLPDGKRKAALASRANAMFNEDFAERVLPFGRAAASEYADIVAERERTGRPISMADAQIAAIVRECGASLATRNTRDFEGTGLTVIDPWQSPSA